MSEEFAIQKAMIPIDPGAIAAAETAKARIQSAYVMAYQKPRNEETSRVKILEACKRPQFAERVEYSKPVGDKKIKGPSIRFAELAVQQWGNILSEAQVIYEDEMVRRTRITIIDLETNATFSKEIQVSKTVERKSDKGREVISSRTNTYGDKVFIVLATDDEVHNKEAALISKVIRNEGLRLIPADIIDEAIETARKTLLDRDAKDPKASKRKVVDSFASIGVKPGELEKYLGHSLDSIVPSELQDLRNIYQAISSGEATWHEYVVPAKDDRGGNDKNDQSLDDKLGMKEKNKPNDPSYSMVSCPNLDGEEVRIEVECEKCKSREGCPSHEGA